MKAFRWKIDSASGTEIDERAYLIRLTSLLCVQYIANGDSGEFFTMHVKLIVEPVLMKTSGPPMIVVNGSANDNFILFISSMREFRNLCQFHLTDDREENGITTRRCCWNLTFVNAGVFNLRIAELCKLRTRERRIRLCWTALGQHRVEINNEI